MSNKDVSIVFKASDRLSESIKGMRSGVKGLQADVNAYRKVQQTVFEEKAKVKLDITNAKNSLKELEKAVRSETEGAKKAWLEQQASLEALQEEYRRLTKVQREAASAEKNLNTEMSKRSNAAGRKDWLKDIAQSGFKEMLGNTASNVLSAGIGSAFGAVVGDVFSNVSSNAISGWALGSFFGPQGALIGAGLGAVTGGIQAAANQATQYDQYFKEEVQNLHTNAITEMDNSIASGSSIAAEREMYQRGFQSVLGKEMGDDLYTQLKAYGDTTAYDTTAMLGKGKEMLTYGIAGEDIMEMTRIIGDIAGGNTNNFSGLAYAISQSMAAGRLNAQDKNQMINYGFNPLEFIAKLQGISVADATKMMSGGQISSDMLMDALRLAVSEGERFHGNANAMADTYEGMQGQLDSAWNDVEAAAGEGFNAKRKEGMAAELDALNGELGEKMRAAYEMAGAYEAELENQHQQMLMKAMEDATKRIEEQGLTGIEAEKVMWEAKTQAEIDYKNSEEYEMRKMAEMGLIERIQEELGDTTYWQFGKNMADKFSQGWLSTRLANASGDIGSHINPWVGINMRGNGNATGLQYVPYDGYIAKLHEGERVLTRQEARQGTGKNITIAKLADSIVVREDADIDKIATTLVAKLMDAKESYVGA